MKEANAEPAPSKAFSHVDASHAPKMVDIGEKAVTGRRAIAQALVEFPKEAAELLREHGYNSAKGPVFHTAIIAGVQAVKRTHELIPFCHPIGIESCAIDIDMVGDVVQITCRVSVEHKTGVEMEAMTGAGIAAMTVYDMCKALTHDLVIREVRLIQKSGGRSDIGRSDNGAGS